MIKIIKRKTKQSWNCVLRRLNDGYYKRKEEKNIKTRINKNKIFKILLKAFFFT